MHKYLTKILILSLLMILKLSAQTEYELSMKLSSDSVMLGGKSILTLQLKYRELEDYTVIEPRFENFSIKEISDDEYKNENGEWINELKYELSAQKQGLFELEPQKADIEFLKAGYKNFDNRHKYLQKLTLDSNSLVIKVSALPEGISVIGIYELNVSVDKKEINTGEPVRFKVSMKGKGNLQNLDGLNLKIPNVTIYEKKSVAQMGFYEKNFEIVADDNFRIPSLSLKYFNQNSKRVEIVASEPLNVVVKNTKSKNKKEEKLTMMEKTIYFLSGVVVALLLVYVYKFLKNLKTYNSRPMLIKELQKAKTKEILLKRVAPYIMRDKSLDRLIYRLEDVDASEFKVIKKEIIKKIVQYIP